MSTDHDHNPEPEPTSLVVDVPTAQQPVFELVREVIAARTQVQGMASIIQNQSTQMANLIGEIKGQNAVEAARIALQQERWTQFSRWVTRGFDLAEYGAKRVGALVEHSRAREIAFAFGGGATVSIMTAVSKYMGWL